MTTRSHTRSRLVLAAVTCTLLSGTAGADVWRRAIDGKVAAETTQKYDEAMARGDEAAVSANSKSINLAAVRSNLDTAVTEYRAAAKLNPKAGEPYYRIGKLLHTFYFDCDRDAFTGPLPPTCSVRKDTPGRELVEAWDAFEQRSPLDPRVNDLLLERAIVRTKLVSTDPQNKALLEAALRDYQSLLDRVGGLLKRPSYVVLGNLAETLMMMNKIDDALDMYRMALNAGGTTSIEYGFAVALDRDDRGSQALAIIRDRGLDEYKKFREEIVEERIFYVPEGEKHYYFALAEEAFGNYYEASREWRAFIQSGAHPQFHARAKEHLTALAGKKKLPRPPEPPDRGFPF